MEKITKRKRKRKEKGEEKLWAGKLADLREVEKDELISRLLLRLKEVEERCEAL